MVKENRKQYGRKLKDLGIFELNKKMRPENVAASLGRRK